jgi:3',5'-cyclic AMP phosphodiesterase CpdA
MLIAHLSYLHVRPAGVLYQGVVDSNAMLSNAVRHLNALDPRPDLVLLSGDLVDSGTAAEYQTLRDLLAPLEIPVRAIPGNHDDRERFRAAFAPDGYVPAAGPINYVCDVGALRVVALDVTVPGLHHGQFDETAAAWLAAVLDGQRERMTLLMMHQPPFAIGVRYLDDYLCRGGEELARLLQRHPQVERVLCGHVHRHMQLRFGGTLLCTAPSTTTAIALDLRPDAEPQSNVEPPGFLLHHWRPDVGLLTHWLPIGTFVGPYPFA